jgi:nucleoid-associated protein YgaU
MQNIELRKTRSSEEVVSMFLGLAIVVVVVGLIFNYFQRRRGSIDLPGITSTQTASNLDGATAERESAGEESGIEEGAYVVKAGDNLWRISESYYKTGYNWSIIAKANNISNPGIINPGQKLVMPQVEVKPAVNETSQISNEYKVIRGDHLWKIALSAYGDGYGWTKIWEANKAQIPNPNLIEAGMTLVIPK